MELVPFPDRSNKTYVKPSLERFYKKFKKMLHIVGNSTVIYCSKQALGELLVLGIREDSSYGTVDVRCPEIGFSGLQVFLV